MSLDLGPYERQAASAVAHFWATRAQAAARQRDGGGADQGERAGVTAGKNMDGFIALLVDLVKANGLAEAQVCVDRSRVTLPGYYRATKNWDLLILNGPRLLAAIELKSQVGPSFGNNFNNRAEEAIGTAHDFWTAYREGVLGADQPRPFLGWLMLVEDAPASRSPGQRLDRPHFDVFPEFKGESYLQRYDILCRKLMLENLYTCAAVVTSPRAGGGSGVFGEVSRSTSPRAFAAMLAGYAAAESIRG
ncbi:MAG: PaeR7I family type II restriction endonuclease [Propionibacteriaceae bacterium]|jgi:hypothetical protein|nr:PaeR7I family type II restriction endonuclease [Propionibacteriaceae bacterium]